MTTNEEILSIVPSQETPEAFDDIDDVEGHGLKEVVVGLSAAAVLSGGAAGAAHIGSISTPDHGLKTPGAVVSTVKALQGDVNQVTDPVVADAASRAGSAATSITTAVGGAHGTAKGAAGTATDTARDTIRTLDGMAADTITQLGDTVRDVKNDPYGSARGTAKKVVNPIAGQAHELHGKATSAVGKADATVNQRAVLKMLDATVADASGTAMEVVLGLQQSDVDAGVKTQTKDAWVVAKAGNEVVGSAQWDGDQVTVLVESRHLSEPITFSIGGQHDIAPLTVDLSR